MRAVVLRGGALSVREIDDPVPGNGELLLRTLSTAICASDVHFMDHPELAIDDPTGRSLYDPERDIVLGHEFVGELIGYGPGCTEEVALGARVTSIPIRLVNGGVDGSRIIGQHPDPRAASANWSWSPKHSPNRSPVTSPATPWRSSTPSPSASSTSAAPT